jgi:DNA polymerase III delta prime subunit
MTIASFIEQRSLPVDVAELFGDFLDCGQARFTIQEGLYIDFKESAPQKFSDSYGAAIVKLAMAFHNTYGGLIVFGVSNDKFEVVGLDLGFDIEAFNRCFFDFTNTRVEGIFREYLIETCGKSIQVLLVPKRSMKPPVILTRPLGRYEQGSLFIRVMHEARKATTEDYSTLFSSRRNDFDSQDLLIAPPAHRSLPPSPATLKDFVGRQTLMKRLWEWFIFGDQPRLYLYGPGGSGKSTMAFEFARTIADEARNLLFSDGQFIDYVIYISGKETELNVFTGSPQVYELRDFTDARSQLRKILFHTGIVSYDDTSILADIEVDAKLDELFSQFSGLIVIDDIDTLSRQQLDTAEDSLFLKIARASKRTRVIYTLRYCPPYALGSAIEVPGLDFESELGDFIMSCCRQFDLPLPSPQDYPQINQKTSGLPLLIETIVGLRRDCGTYSNALRLFDQKGGDEARKYLYQREYDRLDNRGRSRQILAALFLIDAPITFSTLAGIVPSFSEEQVRDAVSETSTIFLTTAENESGETIYQLSPPCVRIVRSNSEKLDYYETVKRAVQQFQRNPSRITSEEKSILDRMTLLIRSKAFDGVVSYSDEIPNQHPIRVHPEFLSLLGQAYSRIWQPNYTRARECFQAAAKNGYWDIYMLRQWYYVEMHSGYNVKDAERVCNIAINDAKFGDRYKSEFHAKLGECYSVQARPHRYTDRSRAISLFTKSLQSYMEASWIGRDVPGIDRSKHLEWLSIAAHSFFTILGEDLEPFFFFLEGLPDSKHDVEFESARTIIDPIRALSRITRPAARAKLRGLCIRSIGNLNRSTARLRNVEGFTYILGRLKDLNASLS